MVSTEMATKRQQREKRTTIPGAWVTAALAAVGVGPIAASLDLEIGVSTIYRWEKEGCGLLEWRGLLSIYGFPVEWKPGDPSPNETAGESEPPKKGRARRRA